MYFFVKMNAELRILDLISSRKIVWLLYGSILEKGLTFWLTLKFAIKKVLKYRNEVVVAFFKRMYHNSIWSDGEKVETQEVVLADF